MAKQNGILKVEGKLGTIVYYKTIYGDLARKYDDERGKIIKTDKRFVKVMAHAREFATAMTTVQVLKVYLRKYYRVHDTLVFHRSILRLVLQIKNLDGTSALGARRFEVGLKNEKAKVLVTKFEREWGEKQTRLSAVTLVQNFLL